MSKFCENCKQDVEPRTPASAIMKYVLFFIFFPVMFSILAKIHSEVEWTMGFWIGVFVAILTIAGAIIFETDKKCPMCNDKRFRKRED